MKRIKCLVILIGCMFFVTGCSSKWTYSDKESKAVADYMASVVLRHSIGYEDKLVKVSKYPFIREEIDEHMIKEKDTTSNQIDIEDTAESEAVVDNRDGMAIDNSSSQEDKENSQEENNITKNESQDIKSTEDVEDNISLAKAFGFNDKLNVGVMKYQVVDELSKGAYIIEASKKHSLVKVEIKIKNKSSDKIKVSSKTIDKCVLKANDNEYYPSLSALENDLMFINKTLDKDESINAIVVYDVDNKDIKSNMSLYISSKDNNKTVKLD